MNIFAKSLAAASIAAAAVAAPSANAQVQGNIAVVNAPAVIVNATAFQTAYQQINTTYAAQLTTVQQRSQQRQTLLQQLDTNSDGQLDEAEQQAAQNSAQAQQIGQIEQEIAQISNQIDSARVYAVEQMLQQYGPALEQVVQQRQIQLVLTPEAVIYSLPAANITQQVAAALNTRVPSVQITPPQGWQPSRQAVAMFQQIQQTLMAAQAYQAQQQAQQQPAQQPTGR